jgi:thymidylate synthase ThyX
VKEESKAEEPVTIIMNVNGRKTEYTIPELIGYFETKLQKKDEFVEKNIKREVARVSTDLEYLKKGTWMISRKDFVHSASFLLGKAAAFKEAREFFEILFEAEEERFSPNTFINWLKFKEKYEVSEEEI